MQEQENQKSYIVKITEILTKHFRVSGVNSEDEAIDTVESLYDNQEIILDASDFTEAGFSIPDDEEVSTLNEEKIYHLMRR